MRVEARMAGSGLLVAIASIIALYGGSSIVAGTRPDHATDAATVMAFYGHADLAGLLFQATISVIGVVFFALAFRSYARPRANGSLDRQLLDFGVALALLEAPVLMVEFGMQLSLVRLAALGDPSLLGVFLAWNWIDNGTMLTLEIGWIAVLSLVAWRTGALPRFNYPDGLTMAAYGPFIAWFVAAGVYLLRGGTTRSPSM